MKAQTFRAANEVIGFIIDILTDTYYLQVVARATLLNTSNPDRKALSSCFALTLPMVVLPSRPPAHSISIARQEHMTFWASFFIERAQ
jgi:hypothetical protein